MSQSRALVLATILPGLFYLISCVRESETTFVADTSQLPVAIGPLAVVAKRIDGFNNHDLDAYLAAHHEDVLIFEYPDIAIGKGRSHLKRIFGPLFDQKIGSIEVQHQVAIADVVVSEEFVNYGGDVSLHIVAIYSVENGMISSFRLVEIPD